MHLAMLRCRVQFFSCKQDNENRETNPQKLFSVAQAKASGRLLWQANAALKSLFQLQSCSRSWTRLKAYPRKLRLSIKNWNIAQRLVTRFRQGFSRSQHNESQTEVVHTLLTSKSNASTEKPKNKPNLQFLPVSTIINKSSEASFPGRKRKTAFFASIQHKLIEKRKLKRARELQIKSIIPQG